MSPDILPTKQPFGRRKAARRDALDGPPAVGGELPIGHGDADQPPAGAGRPGKSGKDGRMPLREHLLELRRRLYFSFGAIALGSIAGWFLSSRVYDIILEPLRSSSAKKDALIGINYSDPFGAFNQRLQVSLVAGLFLTSPIWLYHLWAFITPGLTGKERRYSFGFVAAALPLFLGGATLAWFVLPAALQFLTAFIPEGGSQLLSSQMYFSFVLRITLAFGIAFVLPVILVALNMVGLLPGKTVLRHWRIIVFSCFLFSSVATPTPEATSMCILAGAMCILFAVAVGVCLLLDRRRAKKSAARDFAQLPDDQASPL